jgi:hypothetical protein
MSAVQINLKIRFKTRRAALKKDGSSGLYNSISIIRYALAFILNLTAIVK